MEYHVSVIREDSRHKKQLMWAIYGCIIKSKCTLGLAPTITLVKVNSINTR
jgi:hypothetical protein